MAVKNSKLLKILVLVGTLVMIGVNSLAMFPIINGKTTQAISDSYPNLFTPAGRTFSIWGVIYLTLLVFAIYQFMVGPRQLAPEDAAPWGRLCGAYILTCLVNSLWLVFWQFDIIAVSVVLMLVLLASLLYIMLIIRKMESRGFLRILLKTAFGLYSGWITVATIANITVFLVSIGWTGFGIAPEIWTVAILIVGALIGAATTFFFKNPAYGLVLVWAYYGILQQHLASGIHAGKYPIIIYTILICMGVFCVDIVLSAILALKNRKTAA